MDDRIVFDLETGVLIINDIYKIRPLMTLPEVLESNLMELLSPNNNIGLEYIYKQGLESRILFREFYVKGITVRIKPELSYDTIREIQDIEIFVGNLTRDASIDEFNQICIAHEKFIKEMCRQKEELTENGISFPNGYLDSIFCYRTPCVRTDISYMPCDVLNMSRQELDEWMDEYENELYDLLDDND